MKTPHKKHILKISEDHANLLRDIAIRLNCSNLRAMQFALSYLFKIETVSGKYWRSRGLRATNLYIPMTDEQFKSRKLKEHSLGMDFHNLCHQAIDKLYSILKQSSLDFDNPAFQKYLTAYCRYQSSANGRLA